MVLDVHTTALFRHPSEEDRRTAPYAPRRQLSAQHVSKRQNIVCEAEPHDAIRSPSLIVAQACLWRIIIARGLGRPRWKPKRSVFELRIIKSSNKVVTWGVAFFLIRRAHSPLFSKPCIRIKAYCSAVKCLWGGPAQAWSAVRRRSLCVNRLYAPEAVLHA
jgi:hypothetical protein